MGYVFHAPPSFSSSGTRSLLLYSADGGVDYAAGGLSDGEKNKRAQNLWLRGGIPESRPAFCSSGEELTGALHMTKEFCGSMLLHVGSVLYRLESGAATPLFSGLPDAKSIPVEFSGKLYLYCHTHIYCVDRTFAAKEVYPTAPLYRESCQSNTDVGTIVKTFKPNMLAPYIAIDYDSENTVGTSRGYKFPGDMDKSRHFDVYFEGELVHPSEYTVEEQRFIFKTLKQTEKNSVRLCYYTTLASKDISGTLSGCTVGTAFGGGMLEGTRVILAGNPENGGAYYMSELADPLAFYEGNGGTVGESAGNITAFSKQNGELLVFTESTVSRMSYHYSSSDGGYFSTKTIHAMIGCDVPESVALAGNRTVFANSSSGIYLVDSTELFDRMNIVPISHNITDLTGKRGYFAQSPENRKKAKGTVFDRKYLLCAGDAAFVWDFGAADYSGSDPAKAEKRLVWTEFDGMENKRFLACGETVAVLHETATGSEIQKPASGETVCFVLDSGGMDLGKAHVKKEVYKFALECKTSRKTPLDFAFYADGQTYFHEKITAEPGKDGLARVYVSLPRYALDRFRFVISGENANVGLMNLRVDYRVLKKQ